MRASEILRSLADIVDAVDGNNTGASEKLDQQPDDIFVPPLQLKMELLKKATGVENIYNDPENTDDSQHSYNELDAIKRNAGINPVTLDALGDTEPLDV